MQTSNYKNWLTAAAAITLGLFLFATTANAQAPAAKPAPLTGTWTVDPAHTNVNFTITHFGISQVQGRFDTVSGTIVADKQHIANSSVQFTIQVASVNTNETDRDNDLKSKNYFDAATYPTITFQSTKIAKAGAGYVATGDLTIHGVTKTVTLPFQLEGPIVDPWGASRIGVVIHTSIDRVAYGVGGNGTIADGSFAIGKVATIDISLEATAAKAATN